MGDRTRCSPVRIRIRNANDGRKKYRKWYTHAIRLTGILIDLQVSHEIQSKDIIIQRHRLIYIGKGGHLGVLISAVSKASSLVRSLVDELNDFCRSRSEYHAQEHQFIFITSLSTHSAQVTLLIVRGFHNQTGPTT